MSYTNAVPTMDGTWPWTAEGALPQGPNVGKFKSTLKVESAVAEAKRGDVAVIGPGGEELTIAITNKDLRAFRPTKQAWKDSSEALKFLRDKLGEQGVVGQPTTHSIDITDTHLGGGLKVPVMLKDTDAKVGAPHWSRYSWNQSWWDRTQSGWS